MLSKPVDRKVMDRSKTFFIGTFIHCCWCLNVKFVIKSIGIHYVKVTGAGKSILTPLYFGHKFWIFYILSPGHCSAILSEKQINGQSFKQFLQSFWKICAISIIESNNSIVIKSESWCLEWTKQSVNHPYAIVFPLFYHCHQFYGFQAVSLGHWARHHRILALCVQGS